MVEIKDSDVEAIKDWLAKEPHMPKNFDDLTIKKFLYSCRSSLERTKKCMDGFCSRRAELTEIYSNRDPLSKNMQEMFSALNVTHYRAETKEVLIHQLHEVPTNFDFYDFLKAFTIRNDQWLSEKSDVLPETHFLVLDIKIYSLSLFAKLNIFYLQKFLIFLLECMPLRVKEIHVINCPSFYDYMYNLIKPALPEYLCKLIHFHPDHVSLHKHIDKKYLPKDYDGEGASLAEQNAFWTEKVVAMRETFLNDSQWRADLSKKVQNADSSMSGSFKTIAFD